MATKKTLRKKLEKKAAEYIRLRDNNTCQHCLKEVEGSNRHVSHVIPKSHGNVLRYDEWNLKILCYHCHLNWFHKNPLEAAEWFKKTFPERAKYLQKKKNDIVKFTEEDYEEMIDIYQGKIDNLGGM